MHPKESKMSLAKEIVEMYHGKDAAEKAQSGFMQPGDAPEYKFLRGGKIRDIADTVGISVSELRRLVSAGAIEVVGGEKIENIDAGLKDCTLKIGKHRFLKITFE